MAPPITTRTALKSDGARAEERLTVEEPLELRVAGETVAVTMRTPGEDRELALGFLLAEGVIKRADDVAQAVHCGHPGEVGFGNVIDVTPAPGAHVVLKRLDAARRGTLTTSACGICGRQTIDDLLEACGHVGEGPRLSRDVIAAAPSRLEAIQAQFRATGGLHGCVILDASGATLASAEDIGRHNAVDKAVGALLLAGVLPLVGEAPSGPAVLVVSGRASFEIIQKAVVARLKAVVSVSAASSLAVDLADRAGLTLVSFCRGGTFNVMTHAARLG